MGLYFPTGVVDCKAVKWQPGWLWRNSRGLKLRWSSTRLQPSFIAPKAACCHVTASQSIKLLQVSTCVSPLVSDYNPIQLVCVVQQEGSPNLHRICQQQHSTTISVHSQFQPVASTQCSTHTACTHNYLYITFTFSGISCKSFSFFLGRITRVSPARCAAKTLSFIPPTWINKPNEYCSEKHWDKGN